MLRKPFRYFAVLALSPLLFLVPRAISKPDAQTAPQLTAHEWGTFTSVAGRDGAAVDWLPLTGSVDLPKFVEHLGAIAFKSGLRGTVRMETPVLYFYSPQQTAVSVKVGFSKGVITEWYPHASQVQSAEAVMTANTKQQHPDGSISWDSVLVEPTGAGEFPRDSHDDRYYSARETSANPLLIKTSAGAQHEKFLFYRGVASFRVPLLAQAGADNVVHFETLGNDPIPAAILFERRGTKVGYRLLSPVSRQSELNSPELSSSIDSLTADLEKLLVAQGLFQDEARAMVNTWQDSWFEEGSRLLYILPRQFVDSILPLAIQPAPAKIARVFVGRIELVTPATQRAIESALAKNDRVTLAKYGRFLEPILKTMKQTETDARKAALLQKELDTVTNAEAALEVAGRN
jgi:hypothetical protein